jgi:hypothetical protein
LRVRDDRRDIVARLCASSLGQAAEVIGEIGDDGLQLLHHLGHVEHDLARAVQLRILAAEQLLREHEHARLVFARHAENLHDHVQWIADGNVAHEVALALPLDHARDLRSCDAPDPLFQLAHALIREPLLGERAILRMIRRIHLHQAAHEMRHACEAANECLTLAIGDHGRPVAVMEERVLAADLGNIGVLRDYPERIESFDLRPAHRPVGAQPREIDVQLVRFTVCDGIDEARGDVCRCKRNGAHLGSLPFIPLMKMSQTCST